MFFFNRSEDNSPDVPEYPTNCFSSLSFKLNFPLYTFGISEISFQLPLKRGTFSSKKFLAYSITFFPRFGLYLFPCLVPSDYGITSVPYKALYKLPHLAFAAFKAYLAFITGTTSCGPAIVEISLSTFLVSI